MHGVSVHQGFRGWRPASVSVQAQRFHIWRVHLGVCPSRAVSSPTVCSSLLCSGCKAPCVSPVPPGGPGGASPAAHTTFEHESGLNIRRFATLRAFSCILAILCDFPLETCRRERKGRQGASFLTHQLLGKEQGPSCLGTELWAHDLPPASDGGEEQVNGHGVTRACV